MLSGLIAAGSGPPRSSASTMSARWARSAQRSENPTRGRMTTPNLMSRSRSTFNAFVANVSQTCRHERPHGGRSPTASVEAAGGSAGLEAGRWPDPETRGERARVKPPSARPQAIGRRLGRCIDHACDLGGGLWPSARVLKGTTLEFELRKPFDALVTAANSENGWGARIRT